MPVELLSGNETCAIGALRAGVRFFAGYPITPSTEIAEYLARELPRLGGTFIQMEDEIGSICCMNGATAAGLKAMTATSGPGFSLMQEGLGYSTMAELPCLVVNVMRGGPATGTPTRSAQADVMQVRHGTHGDHPVVCLCPWDVRESFDLTVEAVNISE
ncbi:2-oxoacid:acceptor oxidoreductase subunit alpha, partial [candidate division WOR-3 bacterium]|nr:2-oxoacid:acceptor oxidoreductase subunit alpha [candidate division WOR-3 bacterium]